MARTGALSASFTERGIVRIGKFDTQGKEITYEDAECIAIEAGAEEVEKDESEITASKDSEDTWELFCDKNEVYYVKDHIEKRRSDVVIKDYGVEKFPLVWAHPNDDDLEELAKLNQALLELPEVHKVYINVK